MNPRRLLPLLLVGLLAAVAVPAAFGAYAKAPAYVAGGQKSGAPQVVVGLPNGSHVNSFSETCFTKSKGQFVAHTVNVNFRKARKIGLHGRLSFKATGQVQTTVTTATLFAKVKAKLHFVSKTKLKLRVATPLCFKGKARNFTATYTQGG